MKPAIYKSRVAIVTFLGAIALSFSANSQTSSPSAAGAPVNADAKATEAKAKSDADAERKAVKLVGSLKLDDAAKTARVKDIMSQWLVTAWNWHQENDLKLNELWSQWGQARAVVPKDEFPAEVIASKIDDVYASLKPAYKSFIGKLAAELTQEQIDTIKETWSRSPGMTRTYNAYLEIVPDLNEEQKKVIYNRMLLAREDAMLTDADKEIVNIYKRHKVKVEAYVGTLEWAKLHRAFANKGKTPSPTTTAPVVTQP